MKGATAATSGRPRKSHVGKRSAGCRRRVVCASAALALLWLEDIGAPSPFSAPLCQLCGKTQLHGGCGPCTGGRPTQAVQGARRTTFSAIGPIPSSPDRILVIKLSSRGAFVLVLACVMSRRALDRTVQ